MKKYLLIICGLIVANICLAQHAPGWYMSQAAKERNERNERQAREEKAKQQSTPQPTPVKNVDSYSPQTPHRVKHEETEEEKQLREQQEKEREEEHERLEKWRKEQDKILIDKIAKDQQLPAKVIPVLINNNKEWNLVVPGASHFIAIKKDGTIWGWGRADKGAIGNNSNNEQENIPVQTGDKGQWLSVACFIDRTVAIKADGTLWDWGFGAGGYLGDMYGGSYYKPMKLGVEDQWTSVATGFSHTVVLKNDGSIWVMGMNDHGQLGLGKSPEQDYRNRAEPERLGNSNDWESVSCGFDFTIALKKNGSLWAWGKNDHGQMANGNQIECQISPAMIGDGNDQWQSVNCGSAHSLAIKKDGTLWAWGDNRNGELGIGNNIDHNKPVQVGTDQWQLVIGGYSNSLGIKKDGTLWAWGDNTKGKLGIGNTADQNSPVQIGKEANWKSVSCGSYNSIAIKKDGTVWAWGKQYCWMQEIVTMPVNNAMTKKMQKKGSLLSVKRTHVIKKV